MQTILLEDPEMFCSWAGRLRKERKLRGAGVDRQDIFLSSDPLEEKYANTSTTEDQVHDIGSRNLAHGDEYRRNPSQETNTGIGILYIYRQNHQTSRPDRLSGLM